VTFSTGNYGLTVMNVDLILVGAGGLPAGADAATPTESATPAATTQPGEPGDSPTPPPDEIPICLPTVTASDRSMKPNR
jgi:hypothetical protein